MHKALRNPAVSCAILLALSFGCTSTSPRGGSGQQVRPKVGVALGGGGARGFAHIGVLRVLEQEKIPVDLVVGTSVGALIGALYADTGRVLDAELAALRVQKEDLFDYGALSLLSGGLVKGEKLERFVTSHVRARTIEQLRVPYAAVAVELRTGQTAVFEAGPVARAVHASAAIPGVFVPVEIDGITYVDGGVTAPVPAAIARRKGADVVIAVAIPAAVPADSPRTPVGVVLHTVSIMAAEIGRLHASEADVVVEPFVGDVGYDDFSQAKRLIEAGEEAARAALPRIRAALAAKQQPAR
ncbi:MAG: patatin-like phospholipase family protein [Thermoanaerobaculaceae bacterium]|nr:patatin-like phospholipase family protein [Thermoanaerobaculaceae bacterium]